MIQSCQPTSAPPLARFELSDRLVVLAMTLHASAPEVETELKECITHWKRFGETCLGQALYRHRSFFQNPSGTPAWSHTELSYFRSMVPEAVIMELVGNKQPAKVQALPAHPARSEQPGDPAPQHAIRPERRIARPPSPAQRLAVAGVPQLPSAHQRALVCEPSFRRSNRSARGS